MAKIGQIVAEIVQEWQKYHNKYQKWVVFSQKWDKCKKHRARIAVFTRILGHQNSFFKQFILHIKRTISALKAGCTLYLPVISM